ncbi:hypothetical protein GJU39_11320 [Pedobacter petrophilus]|uniref:DUF2768 family protein n=1 Tax=Pedobacter petrophilus TaxID=1908241 RepID=A0A7K0FYL0_9SPHI|nr:hypothetical protein [Pedobacter petrophilus]MRX76677.1 hypothetical protein [Pedobacter petrophilus]
MGLIIYWLAVVVLFIVGIVQVIIKSARKEPLKPGLILILISVIMLVIGAGACAVILSNLKIGH